MLAEQERSLMNDTPGACPQRTTPTVLARSRGPAQARPAWQQVYGDDPARLFQRRAPAGQSTP